MDQNREYSVYFQSDGNPINLEIRKGTSTVTSMAARYKDVNLSSGVTAILKVTPQDALGVEPLRYDSDDDGTFATELMPTASVQGPEASDVEPPMITFNGTVRSGKVFLDMSAIDKGVGVKSVFYSLDGLRFTPYEHTLRLSSVQTQTVYAFAEDYVANRSGVVTFDLCEVPGACNLVPVNELVAPSVFVNKGLRVVDDPGDCPVGFAAQFGFTLRLRNKRSSPSLSKLRVKVNTLTGGNILMNAVGGPAGVGAEVIAPTVGDFRDGILSPMESVDVPLVICVNQKKPFRFLVDVFANAGIN
jgi:hypothetical protein